MNKEYSCICIGVIKHYNEKLEYIIAGVPDTKDEILDNFGTTDGIDLKRFGTSCSGEEEVYTATYSDVRNNLEWIGNIEYRDGKIFGVNDSGKRPSFKGYPVYDYTNPSEIQEINGNALTVVGIADVTYGKFGNADKVYICKSISADVYLLTDEIIEACRYVDVLTNHSGVELQLKKDAIKFTNARYNKKTRKLELSESSINRYSIDKIMLRSRITEQKITSNGIVYVLSFGAFTCNTNKTTFSIASRKADGKLISEKDIINGLGKHIELGFELIEYELENIALPKQLENLKSIKDFIKRTGRITVNTTASALERSLLKLKLTSNKAVLFIR